MDTYDEIPDEVYEERRRSSYRAHLAAHPHPHDPDHPEPEEYGLYEEDEDD